MMGWAGRIHRDMVLPWLLIGIALISATADAAPLIEVCVGDVATPPLSYPDRDGEAQYLARRAARAVGAEVRFVVEPRRRCLDNVRTGRYPLLLIAAPAPTLLEMFAFPLRNGEPDATLAVGITEATLVARRDAQVSFRDDSLHGVSKPVLFKAGSVFLRDWLRERGLDGHEVRSPQQMADMLLAGRAEAALLRRDDIDELGTQKRFAEVLEIIGPISKPLPVFIVANREYAAAHATQIELFWREVGRLRASPQWPATKRNLRKHQG
jgi:ABC-type amino acid transport substrate-binding protein